MNHTVMLRSRIIKWIRINLIIAFLLLLYGVLFSQNYHAAPIVLLPDSLQTARFEPVDINNDGTLDVVLFAVSKKGNHYLLFLEGEFPDKLHLRPEALSIKNLNAYTIFDYDSDNQMDLILAMQDGAERKTIVAQNQGDFTFILDEVDLPYFSFAKFADIHVDGNPEAIVSGIGDDGKYFTETYRRNNGAWDKVADSLNILLQSAEVFDMNGDGLPDVFFSGKVSTDSLFSGLFIQEKNGFKRVNKTGTAGHSQVSDIDNDGHFEIALSGYEKNNIPSYLFFGSHPGFKIEKRPINAKVLSSFHGDFNSDGLVDENLLSVTAANDTINVINFQGGESEILPHKSLQQQRMSDFDADGDLDVFQLLWNDVLSIRLITNTTPEMNLRPAPPTNAVAVPVYNRTLIFWEPGSDDHTPTTSLTYDLHLESASAKMGASFDLISYKRLLTSHGNNGNNIFMFLNTPQLDLNYAIQSVDNAFHGGGLCIGKGVGCVTVTTEKISACSGENFTLEAPSSAHWFSFADGYLGAESSMNYNVQSQDTVFYFQPAKTGCSVLKTFEIEIMDEEDRHLEEKIALCKDTTIPLSVDGSWKTIEWTSMLKGSLGSPATIQYTATEDDQVTVVYGNESGCNYEKRISIRISIPTVTITSSNLTISRGQSTQLVASGAKTYTWTPGTGLSATDIADPMASPFSDTEYIVTGIDSAGCAATASVTVIVESSGFIPTLFTPNNDGQNDHLKIYGLAAADNFTLHIYNREGSVVYKTNNLSEALQYGWDGTTNGRKQPNGVYYWKVSGSSNSGKSVLLNGKAEGSIVLLR